MKEKLAVCIGVLIIFTLWESQVLALSDQDFQTMGQRYGVSSTLLRAVSIVETREGKLMGEYEVSKVVDTTNLLRLLKIARHTGRPLSDFKGSTAGAMGYMQIMPATFYEFGQDGDADGFKDPLNPYDSLATAAYFLARKLAENKSVYEALKDYNNSDEYCQIVLKVYAELEAKSKLASSQ